MKNALKGSQPDSLKPSFSYFWNFVLKRVFRTKRFKKQLPRCFVTNPAGLGVIYARPLDWTHLQMLYLYAPAYRRPQSGANEWFSRIIANWLARKLQFYRQKFLQKLKILIKKFLFRHLILNLSELCFRLVTTLEKWFWCF